MKLGKVIGETNLGKALKMAAIFGVVLVSLSISYYFLRSSPGNEESQFAENQNNSILLNYKLDERDVEELMEDLSTSIYNRPEVVCQSIAAERTTRQHLYYTAVDLLAELENKYGQHKDEIPDIGYRLSAWHQALQINRDKCESLGYYF